MAVFVFSLVGYAVADRVQVIIPDLPWQLPMPHSQGGLVETVTQLQLFVHAVVASLREELVLCAVLVIFLAAARRPAWEIYALALLPPLVLRIYLLAPAAAVLVSVVVNMSLFRRTGRFMPLVLADITFKLAVTFGGPIGNGATSVLGLAAIPLTVLVLIGRMCLRHRLTRAKTPPGAGAFGDASRSGWQPLSPATEKQANDRGGE